MERKVYLKKWGAIKSSSFCIPRECEEELNSLFSGIRHRIEISNFEDDKSVYLEKKDHKTSDKEFWYLVLTLLKDNGYEFSTYVSNRYEWYEKEYKKLEEERRQRAEQEELKKQERERLEKERLEKIKQEESEYGLLCNKFGCLTNIGYCISKCKYNTVYNKNCRPERVRIKKEGI